MTHWSEKELLQLEPILAQIEQDLRHLKMKQILVLCCGAGELVFRLARKMSEHGKVVGIERSRTMLRQAKTTVNQQHALAQIDFRSTTENRLPFASHTFDALVSEFIVYPTPLPTEIGQSEMARVVKPGGPILLTDVIRTHSISDKDRQALKRIDITYLCDATFSDFQDWMKTAGLTDIKLHDFTPLLQPIWKRRAAKNKETAHQAGFTFLLQDKKLRLGEGIFYIYAKGNAPFHT